MNKRIVPWILLLSLVLAACAQTAPSSTATPLPSATSTITFTPIGPTTLIVMTHDSFAASENVIKAFEDQNNAKVQILTAGDAGSALNKAILSKNNPLADVFYGLDNTFLSRALDEGIFEPYNSPLLADILDLFKLDSENRALPVDYGDVCPNYDKAYFKDKSLPSPQSLEDLLKPEYRGLLVVENPATSSPGLAFLLATIGHFSESGYLDYWRGLKANSVKVVNDWETAYNTEFTRAGGTRPIVISYGSSPPFEMLYSQTPLPEPPTAAVTSNGSCFRQIEFVGILKGTRHRDLAEKWVDFMLSTTFQEDIPLQMYVFPVNAKAKLNETFLKYLAVPQKLAYVSPQDIAKNRDAWLQTWTDLMLR